MALPDPLAVRVNTLKADLDTLVLRLRSEGLLIDRVPWCPEALIMSGVPKKELSRHPLFSEGILYFQNLSSLVPALILAPKPGERVLDLCAAPGSKTTQIAAMMEGRGTLVAVEAVKARFYKLKTVCGLLGANNVSLKLTDGRYYRMPEEGPFDKVLVDAPCSSEGRFRTFEPESYAYWSPRKIREMAHKQKGLLLNASRLVKPGGELLYSTCTFAPEENEGVVDWFLKKQGAEFVLSPVNLPSVKACPSLAVWDRRVFASDLSRCLRILPDGKMSGFFLAFFKRSL